VLKIINTIAKKTITQTTMMKKVFSSMVFSQRVNKKITIKKKIAKVPKFVFFIDKKFKVFPTPLSKI